MSDVFQFISWIVVAVVSFVVYFKLRKMRKESEREGK